MKALRKKYGKRPWIDTPNSAWFRKSCAQVSFLRSAMAGATAAVAYQNIQQIKSAQAISKEKKAILISRCFKYQSDTFAAICERFPMPSPNKP